MITHTVKVGLDIGSDTIKAAIEVDGHIEELPTVRTDGQPLKKVLEILKGIAPRFPNESVNLGITGVGSNSSIFSNYRVEESFSVVSALELLYPDERYITVISMGKESQYYLLCQRDPQSGQLIIIDYNHSDKCAAGSGSFLDKMGRRLMFDSLCEFALMGFTNNDPVGISGRCAVFAESDFVHLANKGVSKERIVSGIHQAVANGFLKTTGKRKKFLGKILFIDGVSQNIAMLKYLQQTKELSDKNISVPEKYSLAMTALGAALSSEKAIDLSTLLNEIEQELNKPFSYESTPPLKIILSKPYQPLIIHNLPIKIPVASLGVDIGSVSTKAALIAKIDGEFQLLAYHYRKTQGNPLMAVAETLKEIKLQIAQKGYKIDRLVAGTTGSGRYLTGDFIGANIIMDEITAQASGAKLVYKIMGKTAILEIGGQDSKLIILDENGEVIDFEMNLACAAGCGAFVEEQADVLGIPLDKFGDYALANTAPPVLNWTCTVFTASGIANLLNNNVSKEDLAAGVCLASAFNYFTKVVGRRDLTDCQIIFQGAVAFNNGMLAALERCVGKKVTVTPNPHITGAIGVARLAYLQDQGEQSFRGFDEIISMEYKSSSFTCKDCPNKCDITRFEIDGRSLFYGDRCRKFSEKQRQTKVNNLPNLFAWREEAMLNASHIVQPDEAKTVGIPRGLMFSELYPFLKAFFAELGFKVIASDPTNRSIKELALSISTEEPCYPFKIAFGHTAQLVQKQADYVFLPRIISVKSNTAWSETCPFLQAAPDVIIPSIRMQMDTGQTQFITPTLHLKRGDGHLKKVFTDIAISMDKSKHQAARALQVAQKVQKQFKEKLVAKGKEILQSLQPGQRAYIIAGRPYLLNDPYLTMDIVRKFRDLDILLIPQDFLPLDTIDITDIWPGIYSAQIQRKLKAARFIRQFVMPGVDLRGVVITVFACGPDSFANTFFETELGIPCRTFQFDEHTGDAGVITRVEAYVNSNIPPNDDKYQPPKLEEISITEVGKRILWVPDAGSTSVAIVAAMRAYGIDARILPRSPDPSLTLARRFVKGDVCLPALMIIEDMLWRIHQPDFDDEKETIFQGNSNGPCRYGMYAMLQMLILHQLGKKVRLVSLGIKTEKGGLTSLGRMFPLIAWDSIVTHDLLYKMMTIIQPYEKEIGASKRLFDYYLSQLQAIIHIVKIQVEFDFISRFLASVSTKYLAPLQELLRNAQRDFLNIPVNKEDRPLVGVLGEFFVRASESGNQNLIKQLVSLGAEAWLAPPSEFLGYANHVNWRQSLLRLREGWHTESVINVITRGILSILGDKHEAALYKATCPLLADRHDIDSGKIIAKGSNYTDIAFGGETICTMGKAVDFAQRDLDGIVIAGPFNCMPSMIVAALVEQIRRKYNNIPILILYYDGSADPNRDTRISNFVSMLKRKRKNRLCLVKT